MKSTFLFMFAAIFLMVAELSTAYPVDEDTPYEEPSEMSHLRMARATCDLFSFQSKIFTPNHSLCASHCLARGKKGGRCINAICHCRN